MNQALVLRAPPVGFAFLLALPLLIATATLARAERAPAAIEYSNAPAHSTQMAALEPARPIALAKAKRGVLTSYGYGAQDAPASGPTIDLRGSFPDAPVVAQRSVYKPTAYTPPVASGPVDITAPPVTPADDRLLGADDAPAYQPPVAAPAVYTPAAAPPRGLYLVQVGAFSQRANAERTRDRAGSVGAVLIDTIERQSGALYRVRVGPWPSRDAAEAARASVVELGFADARVTQAD
jgi:cell division septation protein DedD